MITKFDQDNLDQLASALGGNYSMTLCGGTVRLLCRPLDGRAVCAATRHNGILYLVIDLEKPNALAEARDMINDWRASYLEPVVSDSGGVDLVPLCPVRPPRCR